MIHIVASDWRDKLKKKVLFMAITDNLVKNLGLRAEDVLVVLSPNGWEDWCFGHGLATSHRCPGLTASAAIRRPR